MAVELVLGKQELRFAADPHQTRNTFESVEEYRTESVDELYLQIRTNRTQSEKKIRIFSEY